MEHPHPTLFEAQRWICLQHHGYCFISTPARGATGIPTTPQRKGGLSASCPPLELLTPPKRLGGRVLPSSLPSLSLPPISATPRPPLSPLLPLAPRARAPALLPGLVSARGAPRAGCQVTCVSDNLSQSGPGGPPRSPLVGPGLARLGAGPGTDQLFPELHNNKRTRTGRRPPGQPPQRRSRPAAATSAPARPPARRPPASRKCRRRRGARSLPSPPPPPCRDARRPRGPAGDGKPAPLPRDPPRPLRTSRIPEPARTCGESTSRPPVPVSVVAGTWGVPGLRWPLNTSSQTVATAR